MQTVRTIAQLRQCMADWRAEGLRVGLVPTMGGLHQGHISLVREAAVQADRVVATLFVNPTQFAAHEDLDSYPRDESADAQQFKDAGAALLFAPPPDVMYPPGHRTRVMVEQLGSILEGEHRPQFFVGVATIVTKLLIQAMPDVAVFGEKDYQQLCVIKALTRDLDIPVEIVGAPTVRETDGLAMSSRNGYLSAVQRACAPALYANLCRVADATLAGGDVQQTCTEAADRLRAAGFDDIDYITLCDAETLAPIERLDASAPARALAAAWLGKTRLIDNLAVTPG
jgi:pantoate--beta-alanine ligase